MGRLSNPRKGVEALVSQGSVGSAQPRHAPREATKPSPSDVKRPSSEEKGRLSNPVQRRLSAVEIGALTELYQGGLSIREIAFRCDVHRTTVIHHLNKQGVSRRRAIRKLCDDQVNKAAELYASGLSLAKVATAFGVHEATLTREFRAVSVPIRPRKGWTT